MMDTFPSPCFILDESAFLKNIQVLAEVQAGAKVRIIPALKGFAMWRAFDRIKPHFSGFAASSVNEALLGKEFLGAHCHVYSPAYAQDEFETLLGIASRITFNSLGQWEKFGPSVMRRGSVSCGLRVNPGWSPVKTGIYNPTGSGTRLGMPLSSLPEVPPHGIEGLHIHALCENGADPLIKIIEILEAALPGWLRKIKWLNLGGGHLITDAGYDRELLVRTLKALNGRYGFEIVLEPGAAFAWQAGTLHTTVLDLVEDKGITTAILDASFAAHMPDCLEMPYQPEIESAQKNAGSCQYRLGGNTCLAGDFLGMYGFEKPLEPGDRIIFKDMMHYTMVKTNFFNGVRHPSLGVLRQNGTFELWRAFGYEDYKGKLS